MTVRDLVRQALRMRPDRIVVGEVRGAEVTDLLTAMNTGHDGGAGTVHANSPEEVPARLEALAALGGMDRHALHSQLAAAVQVILHVHRLADGSSVSNRSVSSTAVRTGMYESCRRGRTAVRVVSGSSGCSGFAIERSGRDGFPLGLRVGGLDCAGAGFTCSARHVHPERPQVLPADSVAVRRRISRDFGRVDPRRSSGRVCGCRPRRDPDPPWPTRECSRNPGSLTEDAALRSGGADRRAERRRASCSGQFCCRRGMYRRSECRIPFRWG